MDYNLPKTKVEKNTTKSFAGNLTRAQLTEALIDGTKYKNYIISASHRAQYNGGNEPENSMEGIVDVLRNKKADIVELDIKKSRDGEDSVYVFHDDYFQRTTDFLDKYPGVGTGTDAYGLYTSYYMAVVDKLRLRTPDFSYTNRLIPMFRNVLRYVKYQTQSLINLDIGDAKVLRATWDVVNEEDAFDSVIFKFSTISATDYFNQYYNQLPAAKKAQVIFFPMIGMGNPGHPNDPMGAYNEWENTCTQNTGCLAKGYEMGYRTDPSSENALLNVVETIRSKGRVKVHVFNTYADTYEGRYRGNVNIGQCCNDAYDSRGDWNYLLNPRGNSNYTGANGYIITDDPVLLDEYLSNLGLKSTNP